MTSYQISENINAQSIIWAIAGTVYQTAIATQRTYHTVARLTQQAARWLMAMLPALWVGVQVVTVSVAAVGVIAGAMALVMTVQPVVWVCVVGLFVGGWVTYPRSK